MNGMTEEEVQKKAKIDEKEKFIREYDHDKESSKIKRRLRKTFSGLEEGHKKDIGNSLIEEIASLKAELTLLKAQYELYGSVDDMPQGDYSVLRTSPYYKNYETGLKQYAALYKQLLDMYPKEEAKTKLTVEADPFVDFVSGYQKR